MRLARVFAGAWLARSASALKRLPPEVRHLVVHYYLVGGEFARLVARVRRRLQNVREPSIVFMEPLDHIDHIFVFGVYSSQPLVVTLDFSYRRALLRMVALTSVEAAIAELETWPGVLLEAWRSACVQARFRALPSVATWVLYERL